MYGLDIYDMIVMALCFAIGFIVKTLIDSYKKPKKVSYEWKEQEFDATNPINQKQYLGQEYTDENGIVWKKMIVRDEVSYE